MLAEKTLTLLDLFEAHQGRVIHKYPHHLIVYDGYFAPYRRFPINLLEIGIGTGGSLQLWRRYFPDAVLIGIDLQDCTALARELDARIYCGDQGQLAFWENGLLDELGRLDLVIDDGSHKPRDQRMTFGKLWPILNDGGLYCIEDIHTSYREDVYGGGLHHPGSMVEAIKHLIDDLHYAEHHAPLSIPEADHVFGVHVFPGLAIIEKRHPREWGGSTMRPA